MNRLYVVLTIIFFIGFIAFLFAKSYSIYKNIKRKKEIIARAEKIGVLFYWNFFNNRFGLCSEADLAIARDDYFSKVNKPGGPKIYDKILFYAKPTYTFFKNQESQLPADCGDGSDFNYLCNSIVEGSLCIKKGRAGFYEASHILICENPQLFIPFAGKKPDFEKQINIYFSEGWKTQSVQEVEYKIYMDLEKVVQDRLKK